MKKLTLIIVAGLLAATIGNPLAAQTDPVEAQAQADYELMAEEAEKARMEAERARREAMQVAERARETARVQEELRRAETEQARQAGKASAAERAEREKEMQRARDELSRAHRELREASREVARAHRELGRSKTITRTIQVSNLGDRAVIGVVLGPATPEGVELIGVSPDGPAEQAGIQAGDVIVSIAGTDLSGESGAGRAKLFEVMETAEPGDEMAVIVERDGQPLEFVVTAELREPSSWQSLIRIPEQIDVDVSMITSDPQIIVESIEVPHIDQEALQERMQELQERLEANELAFVTGGDQIHHRIDGDIEYEFESFSDLADHAFSEANVWFGLPHTRGLQFVAINEGLGAYFRTDRGVLVVKAREDNPWQLESGDVILSVGPDEVNSPSDLMRVMRRIEPGEAIELSIKRDRRSKTLAVTVPENRFGFRLPHSRPE
jgi:C-terminal processing protease CtpA/Prc